MPNSPETLAITPVPGGFFLATSPNGPFSVSDVCRGLENLPPQGKLEPWQQRAEEACVRNALLAVPGTDGAVEFRPIPPELGVFQPGQVIEVRFPTFAEAPRYRSEPLFPILSCAVPLATMVALTVLARKGKRSELRPVSTGRRGRWGNQEGGVDLETEIQNLGQPDYDRLVRAQNAAGERMRKQARLDARAQRARLDARAQRARLAPPTAGDSANGIFSILSLYAGLLARPPAEKPRARQTNVIDGRLNDED